MSQAPSPRRGHPGAHDARPGTAAMVRRVDRAADGGTDWRTAHVSGRAPPPRDASLVVHAAGTGVVLI